MPHLTNDVLFVNAFALNISLSADIIIPFNLVQFFSIKILQNACNDTLYYISVFNIVLYLTEL